MAASASPTADGTAQREGPEQAARHRHQDPQHHEQECRRLEQRSPRLARPASPARPAPGTGRSSQPRRPRPRPNTRLRDSPAWPTRLSTLMLITGSTHGMKFRMKPPRKPASRYHQIVPAGLLHEHGAPASDVWPASAAPASRAPVQLLLADRRPRLPPGPPAGSPGGRCRAGGSAGSASTAGTITVSGTLMLLELGEPLADLRVLAGEVSQQRHDAVPLHEVGGLPGVQGDHSLILQLGHQSP